MGTVNLSGVPSEVLAKAFRHLQIVNQQDTLLKTEQCVRVLHAIMSSKTLTNVDMGSVNLSGVPADVNKRALSHLQNILLYNTLLTT